MSKNTDTQNTAYTKQLNYMTLLPLGIIYG